MSEHVPARRLATDIARGAADGDGTSGAVSVPIYQCATFRHPSLGETNGWDYTRQGNPTRKALEDYIALLEGGLRGFDFVDTSDLAVVEAAFAEPVRLLIVETPSNPMMRFSDIAALSALARANGAILVVDNTFLSPYFQKPLTLGTHLVLHLGTKFLAGHNDMLSGFLVAADEALAEQLFLIQKTTGEVLGLFDCWLLIRGIKTLALRMDRQQENALVLSDRLRAQPASGFGSMISFTLKYSAPGRVSSSGCASSCSRKAWVVSNPSPPIR